MSLDHDIPDWFTFVAFFEGNLPADERATLERWIQASDAHLAIARDYRVMWQARRWRPGVAIDAAAGIERVVTAARGGEALPPRRLAMSDAPRRTAARPAWTARPMFRAAAAALVAGLGSLGYRYFADRPTAVANTDVIRETITRRGERASITLSDGTRVILAPESRLRVPATYAKASRGSRDVELTGEAYFDVRHDTARPFRVRTVNGIAEDVGTTFVVTAYPETRGTRVLVASGEIALHQHDTRRPRPLALLGPGDLAHLAATGVVSIQQGVNTRERMGWMSGRLTFVDTPLPEVLAVLQRWYDVEFRVTDPALTARVLTGTFDQNSAQVIVESLTMLLHVQAEWQGRVVTLRAQPRSAQLDSPAVTIQGKRGAR